MESAPAPNAHLDQFYRFALLLGGSAKVAEPILASALAELQSSQEELRSTRSRHAWLVSRIRQECRRHSAPVAGVAPGLLRSEEGDSPSTEMLAIEAYLFAQRFSRLPEPGRSALALLYLDLFPPGDLPALLDLSWEKFCDALAAARQELRVSIQQMRTSEAASS